MNTIAEFTIIGRVGGIKSVGATLASALLRASAVGTIAANGVERTRWNDVTIFGEASPATSSALSSRGGTLAGKRIERRCGDDTTATITTRNGRGPPLPGGRRRHSLLNEVDTPRGWAPTRLVA
jgi:hypothetical protein